jgi:hypothetical protein
LPLTSGDNQGFNDKLVCFRVPPICALCTALERQAEKCRNLVCSHSQQCT